MTTTRQYACGHEFTIEEAKEAEIEHNLPTLVGKGEELELARIKRGKFVKIFTVRRPEIKKRLDQMINEIDHSSQEYKDLMVCVSSENLYNDSLFAKGLSVWPYNLADYWIGFRMGSRFEYILGFCETVIDVFAAAQSSKVSSFALMYVPLEQSKISL